MNALTLCASLLAVVAAISAGCSSGRAHHIWMGVLAASALTAYFS